LLLSAAAENDGNFGSFAFKLKASDSAARSADEF
jgi:hypothetical protein